MEPVFKNHPNGAREKQAFKRKVLFIIGLCIVASGVLLSLPPVAQDISYHNFADQRAILSMPNALNVISNAILAIVGILGLLFILQKEAVRPGGPFTENWERWTFLVLFLGIGLTASGSAFYHLEPNNFRLFWDRLSMTIVFMAFFAITIAERIRMGVGRQLLLPLLFIGIGSVIYWLLTDDLRPYVFVQFFPMIAIPFMLLLFPARYTRAADLFGAVGWYALAKIFEIFDTQIFAIGYLLSGHTLKHLASGLAAYWILRMLKRRRPVESFCS
jgi:hypothetical protein